MNNKEHITKLRQLQTEADAIRQRLGISAPRAVLCLASLDLCGDERVLVEADGFGGAVVSIIEGNYPVEFLVHSEKNYDAEEAAVQAATAIIEQRLEPETAS